MTMKKKFYLFVSLLVVCAAVLINSSSVSAQTVNGRTSQNNQSAVVKLSDIVASSQTTPNPVVIQVPALMVSGNNDADLAAYKVVMDQWMKDHTADYTKLDAKTRAVWEAGNFSYFADYERQIGNVIKSGTH